MRKTLLTALILCSVLSVPAQSGIFGFYDKRDERQFWVMCSLQAFSGVCRGYEQVVTYHYASFQKAFPHANPQFFNPAVSWTNKYKDHDPSKGPAYFLSTSVLVGTTDFKHLMDVGTDVPNYVCITLPLCIPHGKLRWKPILARAVMLTLVREIGFNAIYSVAYR